MIGGKEKCISVFLTEHAISRIEERFKVDSLEQIKSVLEEAVTKGLVVKDGNDILIEHGCLLATCSHDGDGTLTVVTVMNLADGISREIKKRTKNARPTPWEECEVEMPRDEPEELNFPPSSGSLVFSKTEPLEAFLPQQKTKEWGPNND